MGSKFNDLHTTVKSLTYEERVEECQEEKCCSCLSGNAEEACGPGQSLATASQLVHGTVNPQLIAATASVSCLRWNFNLHSEDLSLLIESHLASVHHLMTLTKDTDQARVRICHVTP